VSSRALAFVASAVVVAACFEDAMLADPSTTSTNGSGPGGAGGDAGSTSATMQGGGGAAPECTQPSDCGPDTTCQAQTCIAEMCGVENTPVGTACTDNGGQKCDGAGLCVECLMDRDCTNEPCIMHVCGGPKDDGEPCNVGAECASGNCPPDDHVCCDAACTGTCESCLGAGTCGNDGTCAAVVAGTDPDAECSGNDVCFGGACAMGKIAFVTSNIYNGNLGGLSGADAICNTLAGNACLPGTYMAWLSTAQASPSSRFTQSAVPYRRVDGTQIAANYGNLIDATLDAPLDMTETGGAGPDANFECGPPMMETPKMAWSGTTVTGTVDGAGAANRCDEWTSTSDEGLWGRFDETDGAWTEFCFGQSGGTCQGTAALYCFEQ
jgi:hypothetical protein